MPTTDSVRPLGFWEAITATNARRGLGAGTMVILGEGRGPLDESTFVAAAKVLFERHRLLRCRLDEGNSGLHFIDDVRFEDIPLPVHHIADESAMTTLFEQLLRDELPDRRHLWDAVFAPSPDETTWRIIIKVHHAVADGRSLGRLLDQFIEIAACLLRGEQPRVEPEDVPPATEHRLATPITNAEVHEAMEAAGEESPISPWPLDHEADLDCRRGRIAFRCLDSDTCEKLLCRCHAEGTTLLGAFAAAAAVTHAGHAGGVVDTDSIVPVDLRPHFATPPPWRELQMAVCCVRVFLPSISATDDPWEVAKAFRAELKASIVPAAMPPIDFNSEDLTAAIDGWTDVDGRYRHGWCLTNVGKLDWTGDHPPLTTDRVEMTAAVHVGGFPMLMPMLTHKGVFRVAFTWTEPLMDRSTAERWIDDIWKRFAAMAGAGATPVHTA
ncbi:MAG: hypothetical protein QGI75_08605 [Phycisphaerales bacterium]|nr:hypothetical protein [Phycisphaerales bacterium]MDP6987375.1 hypothetical protein [Phycisphaerales bacterium]